MNRHGLTLIETLLATALLALLASTCVPVLAEALAALRVQAPGIDIVELGLAADTLLENPESHGLATILDDDSNAVVEVPWPTIGIESTGPVDMPITVRAMSPAPESAEHTWIVFSCDDTFVIRWRKLDDGEGASP